MGSLHAVLRHRLTSLIKTSKHTYTELLCAIRSSTDKPITKHQCLAFWGPDPTNLLHAEQLSALLKDTATSYE